jgi:TonB family protein
MRDFCGLALFLLSASVLLLSAQTSSTDLKNPDALFAAALASNGLVGDDMQPWHLKANYDILDHQNKVVATGVFEEWWAAKDKWKRSYTGAHYSDTEYHLPEGDAHDNVDWTHDPWPESEIGNALLTPINAAIPLKAKPLEIVETSFGKLKLNCLRRNQFLGYCLAQGSTVLRFRGFAGLTTTYNSLALFEGRNTALEAAIRVNDHALLNIHVISLTGMSAADEGVLATTAPLVPRPGPDSPVIAGKRLRGDDPSYPPQAKSNHEQGLVVLSGVVNEQGKTEELTILEAPSPALGNAALKAVRTWIYQPYLQNGQPIKIPTTINVVYDLSR